MTSLIANNLEIKIINLPHRQDRKLECESEISRLELPQEIFSFFSATYDQNLPPRGCAISHALAVSEFIIQSEKNFLLVLEDDFEILSTEGFVFALTNLLKLNHSWDVAMFSHNQAIPIDGSRVQGFQRVVNSQTSSSYLLKRHFSPTLLKSFFQSINGLSASQKLPARNARATRHIYALDILWKSLQSEFVFIAAFPALIKQRASFSDVVKGHRDYGV